MKTSPKIKKAASGKPAGKEKTVKTGKSTASAADKAKPRVAAEKQKNKAPNFLDTVYQIARRIPRGRATSYGAIAESAGIRLSARMVGWAMNAAGRANPPVPAHRVVNSKGLLTGKNHFATPTLMQELLENEGITVKNDQIQNFSTVFWDPQEQRGKGKAKKKK